MLCMRKIIYWPVFSPILSCLQSEILKGYVRVKHWETEGCIDIKINILICEVIAGVREESQLSRLKEATGFAWHWASAGFRCVDSLEILPEHQE